MPYLRGFSTLGCAERTLPEILALAVRHQLGAVEVRALGGRLDLPGYLKEKHGDPGQLAKEVASAPTCIVALGTSLKLTEATAAAREALLQFVPWAEALRVPWLRVFDGDVKDGEGGLDRAAGTMAWWRELRARHQWQTNLMVETHDSLLSAAEIERFLAAAPGTAVLWDAHHTWRRGGEPPATTWQVVGRHVVHVHVKDSIARPSARHPFTYVLPGDGEFPMGELRGILSREFGGVVSLEWERHWHPDLPELEAALAAAARSDWW